MLHFRWVLGRRIDMYLAALAGQGHGDLAFEIEMLLTAGADRARPGMGGAVHALDRIAAQELIVGQDRFARGEAVLDGHRGGLRVDFDLGQPGGLARLLARPRGHRKYDLAVKFDPAVGQDRIAAEGRTAIVLARNIGGGQHGDHARRRTDGVEIEFRDPALGRANRITRRDVQNVRRFGHVVDKLRRALNLPGGAVMGDGIAH